MPTLPIGINFGNFLSPTTNDTEGVLHSMYLKGGFQEVLSIDERNAIPLSANSTQSVYNGFTTSGADGGWTSGRKKVGMLVYVLEENKLYTLVPVGFFGNGGNLGEAEWLALSDAEKAVRLDPAGQYTTEAPSPANGLTPQFADASTVGINADPNGCWVELELGSSGNFESARPGDFTMASDVGGLEAGTRVDQLNGQTLNQLFDSILFPDAPTTTDQNTTSFDVTELSGSTISGGTTIVDTNTYQIGTDIVHEFYFRVDGFIGNGTTPPGYAQNNFRSIEDLQITTVGNTSDNQVTITKELLSTTTTGGGSNEDGDHLLQEQLIKVTVTRTAILGGFVTELKVVGGPQGPINSDVTFDFVMQTGDDDPNFTLAFSGGDTATLTQSPVGPTQTLFSYLDTREGELDAAGAYILQIVLTDPEATFSDWSQISYFTNTTTEEGGGTVNVEEFAISADGKQAFLRFLPTATGAGEGAISMDYTYSITLNPTITVEPGISYDSFEIIGAASGGGGLNESEGGTFTLRIIGTNVPDGTTIPLAEINGAEGDDYNWSGSQGINNLPVFQFTGGQANVQLELKEDVNTEGQETHTFILAANDSLGNAHGLGNVQLLVNDTSTAPLVVEFTDSDNLIEQTDASAGQSFTININLDPDQDLNTGTTASTTDWFWTDDPTGMTAPQGWGPDSQPAWIENTTVNNTAYVGGARISFTAGGETGYDNGGAPIDPNTPEVN
jgi:hypothetical protein